jgi:hypothetical protein
MPEQNADADPGGGVGAVKGVSAARLVEERPFMAVTRFLKNLPCAAGQCVAESERVRKWMERTKDRWLARQRRPAWNGNGCRMADK